MSAAGDVERTTVVNRKSRPYGEHSAEHLAEMIGLQLDRGEPFNVEIVFELVARALEAEAAARQ